MTWLFRIDRDRVNIFGAGAKESLRNGTNLMYDSARIDRLRVNVREIPDEPKEQNDEPEQPEEASPVKAGAAQELPEAVIRQHEEKAKAITDKARLEAESMKAEADNKRKEADKLIKEANKKAELILQTAREDGLKEGRKKAALELEEMKRENEESVKRLFSGVMYESAKALDEMEPEIVELCFSVLRTVALLDREADGELFKAAIRKALKTMESSGAFSVRLSVEDCQRFFPDGEFVHDSGEGRLSAAIVPDDGLAPGGIVLASESESVVASVDSQLSKLEIAFRQQLGKLDE
jgi:flagellar assembly protein FliH